MHHIEGAMCGLPVLYIDSGGIPEYCKNYGLNYEIDNLEDKLIELTKNYDLYQSRLTNYPFTGEEMCNNYLKLFKDLIANKDTILKNRKNINKIKLQNQYKLFGRYFYF